MHALHPALGSFPMQLHRPVCSSPTSVCTSISHHLGADPVKPSLFPFIWSPGPVTLSTIAQARPALRTCVWAAGVCVHTGVCVQLDKRKTDTELSAQCSAGRQRQRAV